MRLLHSLLNRLDKRRDRQDLSRFAALIAEPGDLSEGITLPASADIWVVCDEAVEEATLVLLVNDERELGMGPRAAGQPWRVGRLERGSVVTVHEDAPGTISLALRDGVGRLITFGEGTAGGGGPVHWEFTSETVDVFVSHGSVTGSPTLLWTFPGHGTEADMENDISGIDIPCTIEFDLDDPSTLVEFNMEANYLSGAFPDASDCTNLELLDLSGNYLTGAVSGLPASLVQLDISENPVTSMQSFASLPNLEIFGCTYCASITELPDLGDATAMQQLTIGGCGFEAFPAGLSSLTALTIFVFEENAAMAGQSMASFSANTALINLSVADCGLIGNVPDLSANTSLAQFSASGNSMTGFAGGTFPATLTAFYVGGNALPEAAIDAILAALVAAAAEDGEAYLAEGTNAAPSATGLTDKATLESRGWTVTVTE